MSSTLARRVLFYCLLLLAAILMWELTVQAQMITTTTHTTDGKTPAGLQPGSPVGSYPLSREEMLWQWIVFK